MHRPPTTAAVAQTKPLNSMQKALVGLAANLPPVPGNNLQTHLANLKATRPQPAPVTVLASVHDARVQVAFYACAVRSFMYF
jgi:hypothetical protein